MGAIEFYRDEKSSPRARGHDTQLATYLETDCQSSTAVIDDILKTLEGSDAKAELAGNAHHVTVDGDRVSIAATMDEERPPRLLSRRYFTDTLLAWRAFVSENQS